MNYDRERNRYTERPSDADVFSVDAGNIEEIGALVHTAKTCLAKGDVDTLGSLLTQNHALLQQLEVSNETLDLLVQTALENGAIGAKMTGGGLGGCMIALAANLEEAEKIAEALQQAGAVQTWTHSFSNE